MKRAVLIIDSATSVLRVGVALDGVLTSGLESRDRFRHAEHIFGLVEKVLDNSKADKSTLNGLIVSLGPGSFTGLRIGMAAAKGLALAWEIPMAGVSVFSAAANRLFTTFGLSAVLVPCRREEFYCGLVDSNEFDDKSIRVISFEDISRVVGQRRSLFVDCEARQLGRYGNLVLKEEEFRLGLGDYLPRGLRKLEKSGGDDISRLEPLYIQTFRPGASK